MGNITIHSYREIQSIDLNIGTKINEYIDEVRSVFGDIFDYFNITLEEKKLVLNDITFNELMEDLGINRYTYILDTLGNFSEIAIYDTSNFNTNFLVLQPIYEIYFKDHIFSNELISLNIHINYKAVFEKIREHEGSEFSPEWTKPGQLIKNIVDSGLGIFIDTDTIYYSPDSAISIEVENEEEREIIPYTEIEEEEDTSIPEDEDRIPIEREDVEE